MHLAPDPSIQNPYEFEQNRMTLYMYFQLGAVMGMLLGIPAVFGNDILWPWLFATAGLILLPATVAICFLPETPPYLFMTKRDSNASERSLKLYHGTSIDITEKLANFDRFLIRQDSDSVTIWEFLTSKKNMLRNLLILSYSGCLAFGGSTILWNYSTDFLRLTGIPSNLAPYVSTGITTVSVGASLITASFIDRIGRRRVLTASSILIGCCLVAMIVLSNMWHTWGQKNEQYRCWIAISVVCVTSLWLITVLGGLAALQFIPGELLPQNSRSTGFAFAAVTFNLLSLIPSQFFDVLERTKPGTGYTMLLAPFVAFSLIMFRWFPETRCQSMEDISRKLADVDIACCGGKPGSTEERKALIRQDAHHEALPDTYQSMSIRV